MTDTIVCGPRRKRAPQRLAAAAEYAVKMIRQAEDDIDTKKDRASKAALMLIRIARENLEASLEADVDAAAGELAPLVLRAMGRNVSVAEIQGARRALEILLDCLPDYSHLPDHWP